VGVAAPAPAGPGCGAGAVGRGLRGTAGLIARVGAGAADRSGENLDRGADRGVRDRHIAGAGAKRLSAHTGPVGDWLVMAADLTCCARACCFRPTRPRVVCWSAAPRSPLPRTGWNGGRSSSAVCSRGGCRKQERKSTCTGTARLTSEGGCVLRGGSGSRRGVPRCSGCAAAPGAEMGGFVLVVGQAEIEVGAARFEDDPGLDGGQCPGEVAAVGRAVGDIPLIEEPYTAARRRRPNCSATSLCCAVCCRRRRPAQVVGDYRGAGPDAVGGHGHREDAPAHRVHHAVRADQPAMSAC